MSEAVNYTPPVVVPGAMPHIKWIDVNGDGTLIECAVMREMPNGDIYFFPVGTLDTIDKQRLVGIIRGRNSTMHELWDLMSGVTLGNGMNALLYFNPLVKVRTVSGQLFPYGSNRVGYVPGVFTPADQEVAAVGTTPAEAIAAAGDLIKKKPASK